MILCVGCEHYVPEDIDVFELIGGKHICRDCIEYALVSPVPRDGERGAEKTFTFTTGYEGMNYDKIIAAKEACNGDM